MAPPLKNVEVISKHCLDRFMERSGSKDRLRAANKIGEMLAKSEVVQLKPQYRANQIAMRQNFRLCLYRRFNDWVFVLTEDGSEVVTCYPAGQLRWCKE